MNMGKRTIIEVFDDFDETVSDDVVTTAFAFEGVNYEIDLNEVNLKAFREAITPFIEKARRTGGRKVPVKTQVAASGRQIRDWARSQGIEVPDRGIIPTSVKEAFAAANS